MLAEYLDRRFVVQMHVKPYETNLDIIRRFSLSVVYLWRNLGDVIVSFDDHIRMEDHRNPIAYIHDLDRYLALPAQQRYRYLIQHAVPWCISFYLSRRNPVSALHVVRSSYEGMVANPYTFFTNIIEAFGSDPEPKHLRTILASKLDNTRFNHGTVGRSLPHCQTETRPF
jgi:hypothetical protein